MTYDDHMSVQSWPGHPLTPEEWDALAEDRSRHYELAAGVLVATPRPAPHHKQNLMVDLNRQLPSTRSATQDVDLTEPASML